MLEIHVVVIDMAGFVGAIFVLAVVWAAGITYLKICEKKQNKTLGAVAAFTVIAIGILVYNSGILPKSTGSGKHDGFRNNCYSRWDC